MGKEVISPLRQRMIEDMNVRKLGKHSQRSHIHSCKRFAVFLKRSPETATPDDIRRFQLHLIESGLSICNRNCIMTGVKFLVRVTLRRLDPPARIVPTLSSPRGLAVRASCWPRSLHQPGVRKSPDVIAALIAQRVAELHLLAAATAVVWGRSPGRSFEQIAGEAQDNTERFIERTRRVLSAPGDHRAAGGRISGNVA
jgi:hypothetical protein